MATVLDILGLGCQLAGLGVAMWGLNDLSNELFPSSPLPPRSALRRARRMLRIKPKSSYVKAEPGTAIATAYAPRVVTTKRRPSDAESQAAWNAYWDSRLGNLSDDITVLQQDMKEADNGLAKRLTAEADERVTADTALAERLTVVVAGEGGTGLAKAWWGLFITALGVLLQGV